MCHFCCGGYNSDINLQYSSACRETVKYSFSLLLSTSVLREEIHHSAISTRVK